MEMNTMEKMFPNKIKKDEINWTPTKVTKPIDEQLRQAVIDGNVNLVQQLIKSGANVASKDSTFGRTPLGWANCPKVATILLENSKNPQSYINSRDYAGYSPLHIANINGNKEMINLLNQRMNNEFTNVFSKHDIERHKGIEFPNFFSKHDIERHMVMFEPLKKQDSIPWVKTNVVNPINTQLYESVRNSNIASVNQLLENKGDITFKDGTFGRSLLGWARDVSMVTILLNSNANPNSRDFNGYTPLHLSVISGNFDILQFLLKQGGVDPNIRDISSFTALDWSNEVGNTKMTNLLSKNFSGPVKTEKKPPKPETSQTEHKKPRKPEVTEKKPQKPIPSEKKPQKPTPSEKKPPQKPKTEKKTIPQSNQRSQFLLTLSENDASDILKGMPKTKDRIRFVALDYNWGPPVSGRVDTDFLQLWVAVKSNVDSKSVTLSGQYLGDPKWNVEIPFEFKREVLGYHLYYLQVEGRLPVEFVLKLECENGSTFYDNNGGFGVNFRLTPYVGRFTSAIVGNDHNIRVFSEFVHYDVIPK